MQFKKVLFIKVSTKVSTCLHTLRERKLLLLTSEMRVNAKVKDENLAYAILAGLPAAMRI